MSSPRNTDFAARARAFLGSRRCFALIVVFFVLEAAWIALSGRYPMAFDENFHWGVIQLYAHHLSPFWDSQPVRADGFGAIIRDPSYLYHWLMSFPCRFISIFTDNQATQVLFLRFINIGLFAAALPLYRRLLLKTGASKTLVNLCLALFVLVPIAPLLAAQVNYDNLFVPLTALVLLATVSLSEEMRQTGRLNVKHLLYLLILLMSACLVKYAFLPMALVIGAYLLARCKQTYPSARKFWLSLGFGFTLMTRQTRWLLLIGTVFALGLFTQRYGVNLTQYHKPVPDCAQVLSEQRCAAYAPWIRDHLLEGRKPAAATSSPLVFTADWFYGMWLRTFFAVDGPASNFQTRGPFVIPAFGAIIFTGVGFFSALFYGKRILRKHNSQVLWLFVSVIAGYAAVLWLDGYQSFLQTGQAVAINGRYLLPIFPLLILICSLGLNELLRGRQTLKIAAAGLALICMLWGGGTLTYILRSNDVWYWHNQAVYDANHAVQHVLGPITPGYHDPTAFMSGN